MKKKRAICLAIAFVAIFLIAMFFSTNSIVDHVEGVILGSVEPTESDPMRSLSLKYATTWDAYDIDSANITIRRIFVLHNFFDGFMYVQFDFEFFDAEGNRVFTTRDGYGRGNIERWTIHRGENGWEIVKIKLTL